ncbi:hypothetical protein MAR_021045, partial [Mya arenaria]
MTAPQDSSVTVNAGDSTTFKCRTSGGLPQATIKWFKVTGDTCSQSGTEITSSVSSPSVSVVEGLKQVESTLTFTASGTDNELRICCIASNVAGRQSVSGTKLLNVRYAPSDPPVIEGYASGSTYSMIENSTESITCSSTGDPPSTPLFRVANVDVGSGIRILTDSTQTVKCTSFGNPSPTSSDFTWRKGTNVLSMGSVLNWPGGIKIGDEGSYTCIVETIMTPSDQNPPELPTLYLGSSSGPVIHGPLTLVVQRPFTLVCDASSKPPANFSWAVGVNTVQGQLLQDMFTTK